MKVYNPNKLPVIDYREVLPLQAELKDLNEANYNKLKNVLNKRGFKVPLFLWQQGDLYYLLDGHQRQRVMVKENMQPYEVPYILIDADTEAEAKAQLLEIASQYGTITQEGFDSFVIDLPELDIQDINFDALQFVGQEPEVEEDEAPEVSSEPAVSKLGEVYQLGRHRLMCGDSADPEQMKLLMNGEKADLYLTDPPYGVDYNSVVQSRAHQKTKAKDWGEIYQDDLKDENYQKWLVDIFNSAKGALKPRAAWYIWYGQQQQVYVQGALTESANVLAHRIIIWVKPSMVFGRGHYHWRHEACIYGWVKGSEPKTKPPATETTVWEINARKDNDHDHPTQKPNALMARAIKNSSNKDEIVLDTFGGGGGTLLASEQLSRTCHMMEIAPEFCDVIRKRYAKFKNDDQLPDNWTELTPAIQ